jgi:hypothetical protein
MLRMKLYWGKLNTHFQIHVSFKFYGFRNNQANGIFISCHLTTRESLNWFWSGFIYTAVTEQLYYSSTSYLLCTFPSMALPARSGPRLLIQLRNHFSQTVGLIGRVISPSQGLYLNTGQRKHRINSYTHQTSMPWVELEPTIPASERTKTVHALDRAATVTALFFTLSQKFLGIWWSSRY